MAEKQLIVAVEGTAAMGPFWSTIVSDYLHKIIRSFCNDEEESIEKKKSQSTFELALVTFNTHRSQNGCTVQRSAWTRHVDVFLQWLSGLPFAGGGFDDAAIAEGLSEALMMFNGDQTGMEDGRHCVLIAASNPYPFPTPLFRPKMDKQNPLSDAETVAKSFSQCFVSLSVISPRQLPKLRAIYNAGKRNPEANNPFDDYKEMNPNFLVLISENFLEARAALREMPPVTAFGNCSESLHRIVDDPEIQVQPRGTTIPPRRVPGIYAAIWKGNMIWWHSKLGREFIFTNIHAYRILPYTYTPTLAEDWPATLRIAWWAPEEEMKRRRQTSLPVSVLFKVYDHLKFYDYLKRKNLCAVIELPSQWLVLVPSKVYSDNLLGKLYQKDRVLNQREP